MLKKLYFFALVALAAVSYNKSELKVQTPTGWKLRK